MLHRVGVDSRYALIGFPTATIAFVLLVTGFAAGMGLIPLFGVGLLVLAVTLLIARGFADLERYLLPEVLGRPVARPRYRPAPPDAGQIRRLLNPLTNGQTWLDLLHGIIVFPFAILAFVITVTWWAVAAFGLLYPLYGWILQRIPPEDNQELPELLGFPDTLFVNTVFNMAVGLVFALTLPMMVRLVVLMRAGIGRALLTTLAEMHDRIDDLTEGRAAAVSAEATALRKIERDIHDGPQQRLVHLAMELSRAQRQMSKDPQAAENTLAQAITQTRETLDELRTLSRGIAPPILTDRGIAPALAALASRCTIPVQLEIQTEERFPAAVENTIYFVAAESLANAAKHSQAQLCTISLRRVGDRLTLIIGDDGVGGAHVAKGHGLAGLTDRLRAVDGELAVQSPPGGPTVIGAEVPCA
ncbi:histidine kinase [Rhizocola hellebori]|uniref:histidine kinase n=1 Tax=Rhizocola hellebori TaxID=1392758 RepID=A0A8J3VK58_9ACTN|nr:histidine kinase [Rhizocola hellebori]